MSKQTETLKITMGTSPDFLEQILTKDVSTLEAIYDLVDNSIDAARNQIFSNKDFSKDKFGLPKSYEGFSVSLDITEDTISIKDNCLGMDKDTLANKAFVIATTSNHDFGIGQYGIGLKRSLLKMGNKYQFTIDNGEKIYSADFSNLNIGGLQGDLLADVKDSKGKPCSIFTVYNLKDEIIRDIQNHRWIDNAIQGIEDRYSIYFSKGFSIHLNYFGKKLELNSRLPNLRIDGKFLPKKNEMQFGSVKVIIESGIHENYYFPTEEKYSLSENRKLTNDFGIYFICNDRVIVKSSTDSKHGWKTKWHSEYNGFVCLVRFISKSPSDLPWNTAKSAMREDASLFLDVIDKIQPIADTYRSEIKQRYIKKKKNDNIQTSNDTNFEANNHTKHANDINFEANSAGKTTNDTSSESDHDTKSTDELDSRSNANSPNTPTRVIPEKPPETKKKQPPKKPARDREKFIIWEATLTRVPQEYKSAYAILYEMGELSSKEVPIACVALLRLFLEESVKTVLKKMNLLNSKVTQLSLRTKNVVEELHKNNLIDSALKDLINQYAATTKHNEEPTLFSINSIQSQIHSSRFHPSQSRVNNYWDELDPFLAACWDYINEKDNSE